MLDAGCLRLDARLVFNPWQAETPALLDAGF